MHNPILSFWLRQGLGLGLFLLIRQRRIGNSGFWYAIASEQVADAGLSFYVLLLLFYFLHVALFAQKMRSNLGL